MRQAYAQIVRTWGSTALIGLLALVPLAHVDPWSWVAAPVILAVGAVAQTRALFSEGGPFRT